MDSLYRSYPSSELVRYDLGWHEPPFVPESVREMHRQAQWLLNDIAHDSHGASPRWLTLCGHSGCGKSHLAAAIRLVARRQFKLTEQQVQLRNVSSLASRLRDGDMGLLTFLSNIQLLILDDLGSEYKSEKSNFIPSKFYELLESRLNKWTVITSNLSLADIADRLDVRIASRITRGANILVESKDPFDFCWKAKEQNYTSHIKKHENRIHTQTQNRNTNVDPEPPTSEEQAQFQQWLRDNIRAYSAAARVNPPKNTRIPR